MLDLLLAPVGTAGQAVPGVQQPDGPAPTPLGALSQHVDAQPAQWVPRARRGLIVGGILVGGATGSTGSGQGGIYPTPPHVRPEEQPPAHTAVQVQVPPQQQPQSPSTQQAQRQRQASPPQHVQGLVRLGTGPCQPRPPFDPQRAHTQAEWVQAYLLLEQENHQLRLQLDAKYQALSAASAKYQHAMVAVRGMEANSAAVGVAMVRAANALADMQAVHAAGIRRVRMGVAGAAGGARGEGGGAGGGGGGDGDAGGGGGGAAGGEGGAGAGGPMPASALWLQRAAGTVLGRMDCTGASRYSGSLRQTPCTYFWPLGLVAVGGVDNTAELRETRMSSINAKLTRRSGQGACGSVSKEGIDDLRKQCSALMMGTDAYFKDYSSSLRLLTFDCFVQLEYSYFPGMKEEGQWGMAQVGAELGWMKSATSLSKEQVEQCDWQQQATWRKGRKRGADAAGFGDGGHEEGIIGGGAGGVEGG